MTESRPAQSARTFFWLASLIVGGLLFALGIMVGRSMTAGQHTLDESAADRLHKIDQRDIKPVQPKTDLVYPQALSGPPTQPAQAPVVNHDSNKQKPVSQPELQAKQGPKPKSESRKPPASPEKVEPPASTSFYCLQVASFQKLSQAQTMISTLEKKGYTDLHVVTAEVAGKGRHYRVRMGRFEDRDQADAYANKESLTAFVLKCSE